MTLDYWIFGVIIYILVAFITLIPTFRAILQKVKLNPGGDSFDKSTHFSPDSKELLKQNFSRIEGTLVFWKNQAEKYKSFHYYCLFWTIPVLILIPILTQYIDGSTNSKVLLTVLSIHVAIVLGFHKGFKVENNYKAFRQGESEFYDLYRRLLDRPESFGNSEDEQLTNYFKQVDLTRKNVRNAEVDNLPTVENLDPTFIK